MGGVLPDGLSAFDAAVANMNGAHVCRLRTGLSLVRSATAIWRRGSAHGKDTAAHLVDRILPEVRVRQWVLTLPYPLRYRGAYDARLNSEVLRAFIRSPFAGRPGRGLMSRLLRVSEAGRIFDRVELTLRRIP